MRSPVEEAVGSGSVRGQPPRRQRQRQRQRHFDRMHRMVNRMTACRDASRGPSSCPPSCASCQNAVAVAVVVAVAVAAAALELTHYRKTMQLRDAKVLVTGGSSGIGLATARLLTERGAKVAISGRRENRL